MAKRRQVCAAVPKGTNLAVHSHERLDEVAGQLNLRPRKTLGFETPAERFEPMYCDDRLKRQLPFVAAGVTFSGWRSAPAASADRTTKSGYAAHGQSTSVICFSSGQFRPAENDDGTLII